MLYLYNFYDEFEKTENGKRLLDAINNCKELKPFGDGEHWISKSESVMLNEEEIKAKGKLCDYIDDWFDADEYMEIFTLLVGKVEIDKVHAAHLLSDDLRTDIDGANKYEERIWNAESPDEEIETIVKELGLVVLDLLIKELQQSYEHIEANGFEWK